MSNYNEKIDRLIEGWRDEIFEKLRGWVAIDSKAGKNEGEGKPFGSEVRKMLDLALKDAADMGFATENFHGYCGHAVMGEGEQSMGILAHLDVVPAGDGWTHDPFGGEIENGRFYARGAIDDKGPAMAALYAMRAVRDAGVELKDSVRLILGCDEETGMTDMRHYAKCVKLPDYGFSPDAEYPVINIEKGGLGILLTAVCENDDEAEIPVYSLYAGERPNVVPGTAWAEVGIQKVGIEELKARLNDERIEVTDLGNGRAKVLATGVSAHASTPHLGVNAAGILLIGLKNAQAGGGSKAAICALAEKIGLEGHGESLGIAIEDELSGKLTCNMGILRFDGRVMTARLDIRYPIIVETEGEGVTCGRMSMALSGTPFSVKRVGGHGVLHVPAEHKVVQGLLKVYHDLTGLPAHPIAIGGGTYSRTMPNTVAFGPCFPGDPDPCHMPDESIDIEKYMTSIRIMAHAIETLAGK